MHIERSKPRISPTDFVDFSIQIQVQDLKFNGYLGNISEEGLGIIIPFRGKLDEINGLDAKGRIGSKRLKNDIAFTGKVAWNSMSDIRKEPHLLLGIQFTEKISLPEELIAIGLSTSD